ncbi:MAG: amino acid--tRNA ligase-related protein, partial [Oscillospiraceae bacterium]|nr:amino acid--tRNA ligase-related protein [Oscillospiraceae bacterium]
MSEEIKNEQQKPELSESEQIGIRKAKLQALKDAGRDPFETTKFPKAESSAYIVDNFDSESLDGRQVCIAGRITSWRDMGKANFIDLRDREGKIQVYVRRDDIGEEEFAEFKSWDIGDIVGVEGFAFRTRRGEVSVHAQKISLLAKALRPLPEKYHGLRDTELRYRRRYLDLIVNPEVKEVFVTRSKIIRELRAYLDGRGFYEVETPVLHSIAGGAAARPFITHHNALDMDMYLRIALELHLKRLIVGGLERVYEIGRTFRNEGIDTRHNPEFTMLECYMAYADYRDMMDMTEDMIR